MSVEQGFALHPLAAQDITDLWEFIAADNPLAARRQAGNGFCLFSPLTTSHCSSGPGPRTLFLAISLRSFRVIMSKMHPAVE
jgi:hypothetical protein